MFATLRKWCRVRRRYMAYFSMLMVLYFEMTARFGIPIAILKGLVKKDCEDENDEGTFCWSEKTQAFVIGAYFYGYTAQSLTTFIARKFTGFFNTYRFWLLAAGIIEVSFPAIAALSVELLIVTQTIRGFLAGIMVAFNFNYLAKFSVADESKTIISIIGAMAYIGSGTGGLLAALIIDSFTWRHYFYCMGAIYLLGLISHLLFVHESPENSWYLTAEEKEFIMKSVAEKEERNSTEKTADGDVMTDQRSLKPVLCRVYLPAFCIFSFGKALIFYNILNVIPFYLNEVLDADPLLIAYLNTALCILMAVGSAVFSALYQTLDRYITWLQCRMIFTVLPLICQIIFAVGMSYINTITGGIVILALCSIATSTNFSGGIVTVNYELDPPNSALLQSIWNSFGQVSAFVGPLMMAAITHVDPETPDRAAVYKQRWSVFFDVVAGFAALSALSILVAYFIKKDEWVPYKDRMEAAKCCDQ